MLKLKFVCVCFLLMITSCHQYKTSIFSEEEAWKYFEEIVLGSEYQTSSLGYIKKWQQPIQYILVGQGNHNIYRKEMNKIASELRELTCLEIKEVRKEKKANIIIFVGRREGFEQMYKINAQRLIKDNDGFFWIYWNKYKEIYKAHIYINILAKIAAQKHLLREEFTQSLGLINDSYKYTESIFQTQWTYVQKYTKIDKFLIQVLYDEQVQANMKTEELKVIFPKLYQQYY